MALYTNLGLAYYQRGYFSKAIAAFERAWQAGQAQEEISLKPLIDRAAGELARMHARLGHADALAELLDELHGRSVSGPATEAIAGAREGLWAMRHDSGVAYLCGPMALKNLLLTQRPARRPEPFLDAFRSGPNGVSLAEVARLAGQAGFGHRLVYRRPGQTIPVPSIVHWQVNHFAAIVGESAGRLHVQDPTFGADLWVTPQAIDAESSGYFLIPDPQPVVADWRPITPAEAELVRGRGYTGSNDPRDTTPQDDRAKPDDCEDHGLCGYNFTEMVVSLTLRDTPVGYAPPKGPAAYVSLSYNQREASQPAVFGFFNVGPKWSMNWLSYIQDDPNVAGASVTRIVAGGGSVAYGGYQAATRAFAIEAREAATLVRLDTRPVSYERRLPDGRREIYAQTDGAPTYPRRLFLSQRLDAAGNAVTLAYDAQLRLTTLTDATGRETRFAYERSDRPLLITRITDPFGRSAQLNYDTAGRLVEIVDVLGLSSRFGYDGASLINTLITPYGTTRFAYGEDGTRRWVQATDPLGHTERLEYLQGAPGIPSSEPANTVPQNIATYNIYINGRNSFYWDKHAYELAGNNYTQARIRHWVHLASNLNVTANAIESVKFPLESRIWMTYPGQPATYYSSAATGGLDKPDRIARVLDDGTTQLTRLEYNSSGRLTRRIDPLGREMRLNYAANQIDVLGIEQRSNAGFVPLAAFTYNARHRPLTLTDAAGQTTSFTYNAAGQLTSATDALGQQTQYAYDALGYLTRVVDANGATAVSFTYDAFGRLATRTDSGGHTTGFEYDALDRLTRVGFPDGSATLYGWERLDLASVTDRLGRVTRHQYDANRQRVAATDALGRTTRYGYYPNGALKTLTDANGNVTTWERDLQSRLTARVDASGQRTRYAYEGATSRLHSRTDALGQLTTYGYARDDRLTALDYTRTVNPTPSVRFDYDAEFARLGSMHDGNGSTTFQYHPPGHPGALRLALEDGPYQHDTVAWTYDALGRPATRSVDDSTEIYRYDRLGRLVERHNELGTLALDYLGETGQLLRQALAGTPIATTFEYADNTHDRQLVAIDHSGSAGRYAYERDALGKILRSTETAPDAGAPRLREYAYDAADRLLGVRDDSGGLHTYAYDALDNLLVLQTPDGSRRARYNALNQLVALDDQPFDYDANGNRLGDGPRRYRWDAENRLIGIDYADGRPSTRLRYDGLGRRLAIVDPNVFGSSETRFLWCGGTTPCQARSATDTVLVRYYPHGEVRSNLGAYGRLYYARDPLGSVRALQTAGGQTLKLPEYSPWGQPGTFAGTEIRFAGMYYHAASGLYLTPYRAYDPRLGRWLSQDPLGVAGGINLYGYVGADPVNRNDPSGLCGPCAAPLLAGASLWLMSEPGQDALRTMANACASWFDGMFNGNSSEDVDNEQGADSGNRFPDRDLPRDQHGNPVPDSEAERSYTQLGQKNGRNGRYDQAREFDANGKPVRDIDFTDHGRPGTHPNPHQHDYIPNPTGGTPQRGPTKPLGG